MRWKRRRIRKRARRSIRLARRIHEAKVMEGAVAALASMQKVFNQMAETAKEYGNSIDSLNALISAMLIHDS